MTFCIPILNNHIYFVQPAFFAQLIFRAKISKDWVLLWAFTDIQMGIGIGVENMVLLLSATDPLAMHIF